MKKEKVTLETIVSLFNTGVVITLLGYIIYGAIAHKINSDSEYYILLDTLKNYKILVAQMLLYGGLYVATDMLLFRPLLNVLSEVQMETFYKKDIFKIAIEFVALCAIYFAVDRSNVINDEGLTNIIGVLILGWKIIYELFFQSIIINSRIKKIKK